VPQERATKRSNQPESPDSQTASQRQPYINRVVAVLRCSLDKPCSPPVRIITDDYHNKHLLCNHLKGLFVHLLSLPSCLYYCHSQTLLPSFLDLTCDWQQRWEWQRQSTVVSTEQLLCRKLTRLTDVKPIFNQIRTKSPARSSVGALVSPQGDAEAQQNDAQTLTHGATWTQRLRSRG
jgi:hypothetical protein